MIKVREVKIAIEVKRSDADDVLPVAMFNQNSPWDPFFMPIMPANYERGENNFCDLFFSFFCLVSSLKSPNQKFFSDPFPIPRLVVVNIFFEVEMRKKEMRKIAELKDSYLDCRRRAGSEEAYIARYCN